MSEKPKVIAWMRDAPIADDDPYRAIKLRARELAAECDRKLVRAAAGRLEEAAGLFHDPAFDPGTVWDTAAAVLSESEMDAAGHIAVTLREIETGR